MMKKLSGYIVGLVGEIFKGDNPQLHLGLHHDPAGENQIPNPLYQRGAMEASFNKGSFA
jgi:hypothetical protein